MHNIKYFFLLIIAGILLSSCEKNDNTVIDPILKFPVIDSASITPNLFDTSYIHGVVTAYVTSAEPIQKVTATVYDPINDSRANITLSNSGGNKYTGVIDFNEDCRLVGQYTVQFMATNIQNLNSNQFPVLFHVTNSHNHKPVISNLIITPKNVVINNYYCFVFEVTASDPDGSCDINRVFYYGHYPNKPDSALTQHNLYDDGSCCPVENSGAPSGDTTANDGKFTRLLCGAPNMLGYYVYHVVAVDRSNDTSNVLSDSIYVHP